jgi:hypothetical protein
VIPGNHDRYRRIPIQQGHRRFEKVFNQSGYARVEVVRAARGGTRPDIILFLFDSTQTLGLRVEWKPWERIARGEVSRAECDWLLEHSQKIAADEAVGGEPIDLGNCVRIAVLHHHPVLPSRDSPSDRLKEMENGEAFRRACVEAGMNMVLFGHQHFAYQVQGVLGQAGQTPFGPAAPVYFLCCASTTEYSTREPGFYVYDVNADGCDVYQFRWEGDGFDRVEHRRLPF